MSKVASRKVFVLLPVRSVEMLSQLQYTDVNQFIESSVHVSSFDLSESGDYIKIAEREISFALPELSDAVEMCADSMELALQKMRAEHHQQQQDLIGRISKYRQLASPQDVEVIRASEFDK